MRASALARLLLPSGTTGVTDPGFGSSSGVAGRIISVSFLRSCVPDSSCMSERRKPYPFDQLEPKWQALWEERRAFHAPNPGEPGFDPTRPKYYVLDMFPYPSGSGLHVGHPEGYTATDIVARYKRLRGFNVLHPMGWDAFGLPAEQYAIRTGQHPEITTRANIAHFKKQLKRIGFSYDWEREISTADPDFYRWTQWIFLQIYNSWFNPETDRAEPISTYRGRRSRQRPPRLCRGSAGKLVPRTRHRSGQRRSHRRQERSGRVSGREATDAAMDVAHHRFRRTLDRRIGAARLAGGNQAPAAQLDRAKRRRG